MTGLVVGLSPGAMIDGFRVIKSLGDGGFAFVYLVEKNGKLYALKLARHRDASGDDNRTHARTLRELGILLLFADHPNIVQACGYGYLPDKASGNVFEAQDSQQAGGSCHAPDGSAAWAGLCPKGAQAACPPAGSIARAAPSAALLGPSAPSLPLNRAPIPLMRWVCNYVRPGNYIGQKPY